MLPRLYPNQRAIRVVKELSNKDNLYSIFNQAALLNAMQNLKPSAFKLWAYLNANQDGYEFGLSGAEAQRICGFSCPTYLSAFNELVEKGYLEEVELYPALTGYLFREAALEIQKF